MISPLASIAPGAKIGKNVIIQPFAYIEDNVEIGDDCIIMPYASVCWMVHGWEKVTKYINMPY